MSELIKLDKEEIIKLLNENKDDLSTQVFILDQICLASVENKPLYIGVDIYNEILETSY